MVCTIKEEWEQRVIMARSRFLIARKAIHVRLLLSLNFVVIITI